MKKGVYRDKWFLTHDTYLKKAITTIEERFGSLKTYFGRSTNNTPGHTTFHPELDIIHSWIPMKHTRVIYAIL